MPFTQEEIERIAKAAAPIWFDDSSESWARSKKLMAEMRKLRPRGSVFDPRRLEEILTEVKRRRP